MVSFVYCTVFFVPMATTWLTPQRVERLERKWREAVLRRETMAPDSLELDEEFKINAICISQDFLNSEAHMRRFLQSHWEIELADRVHQSRENNSDTAASLSDPKPV